MKTFAEFGLPPALLQALEAMDFKTPTPIQEQAIAPAMEGKDILAIAPTGTGKTGAFGIPTLAFLYPQPGKQVLVLAPTRELAAQIHKFLNKLGNALDLSTVLIVGGESFSRQRTQVKRGVDIIIATPGRLWDHIEQGMPIQNIAVLVLDEVDRMLDMGFAPQVEQIAGRLAPERQTYLFSATMPKEIVRLVNKYLKDPIRINVSGNPADAPKIAEENIDTTDVEKPRLLIDQVLARTGKILVFANTQGRVEQVARRLEHEGHPAACMHGGRTHGERKSALEAFRSGAVRVLVATDIAARGIDVVDVEHVINYDYPATKEDYLHRIGRTGRCGKEGSAVTFVDARRKRMSMRRQGPRVDGAFGRDRSRAPQGARPARGPRPDFKRSPRPDFHAGPRPDFAAGPRPDFKRGPRPDFQAGPRPDFQAGPRPDFKRGPRPDFQAGPRPDFKRSPRPDASGHRADYAPGGEFKRGPRPEFRSGDRPDFKRGPRPDFKSGGRPDFAPRGDFKARGDFKREPRSDFQSGPREFKPRGFKPDFKSNRDAGPRKPFAKPGRPPAGRDFDSRPRPPHPRIFREGEERPQGAAPGPRRLFTPKQAKKDFKREAPHGVRGGAGTLRRKKPHAE